MFVHKTKGTKKESVYSQKKIYCITQNGQLKENPKKIKKNKNKFRKSRSLYFVRFSVDFFFVLNLVTLMYVYVLRGLSEG